MSFFALYCYNGLIKSQSLIARELRDALCVSAFMQPCYPPEAQSSTQGIKSMLNMGLFCTYLVDLRHKNPVSKIEKIVSLH